MRKSPPPKDFDIHVDPSCLSNPTEDKDMSAERVSSGQTVVHHDSWAEGEKTVADQAETHQTEENEEADQKENSPPIEDVHNEKSATVEDAADEDNHTSIQEESLLSEDGDEARDARERQIDRIEAQIQAAARAVVASIEKDYRGEESVLSDQTNDDNLREESLLSTQTDESYDQEGTELTYDGTDISYGDGTEVSYESGQESTLHHEEDSKSVTPGYHDQTEHQSEQEGGGDSSSHHDGDIDDDVFSNSDRSNRSSLNSCHELSDEHQKLLTSPAVGEEAASANEGSTISRIPSSASYLHAADSTPRTPSKVLSRPPFRTPSSVRNMQMSSPTPSLYASPRSVKRHIPTVSRIGTPNSQYSPTKRTPTRFKPKKEVPLVLLHVTVLPLQWPYSHLMMSAEIPESLQTVKESWRMLQDKLGDTVFERGILLSHPHDSYEVLEERFLEALELPFHPRAMILKCGHYMGPLESPSSDEEGTDYWTVEKGAERKWCDICGRDVRLEEVGDLDRGEKRFRIKVYASNGLMRAGAWEAAWKEMERVDVEIEPFVEPRLHAELEHLAAITPEAKPDEPHLEDDGFVDEEVVVEHVHDHEQEKREEEARLREEERLRRRLADKEEMERRLQDEEELRQKIAEEEIMRQRMVEEEEAMMHKAMEEERMREIYGQEPEILRPESHHTHRPESHHSHRPDSQAHRPESPGRSVSRSTIHDDSSLPELLLAAFKVAMRDSKNVAIGVLSVLILLLALRPGVPVENSTPMRAAEAPVVTPITTTIFMEAQPIETQSVAPFAESVLPTSISFEAFVESSQPTSVTIEPVAVASVQTVASEQSEPVTSEAVQLVTTTVYRERTVTEIVPASTPTPIESVSKAADPCETVVKSALKAAEVAGKAINDTPVAEVQDIELSVLTAEAANQEIQVESLGDVSEALEAAERVVVPVAVTGDQNKDIPAEPEAIEAQKLPFVESSSVLGAIRPDSTPETSSSNEESGQKIIDAPDTRTIVEDSLDIAVEEVEPSL